MKVVQVIILTIHLMSVVAKKRSRTASSESIENILYYKDCNHKQKPTATPLRLRSPPQQHQECKMCCTMCCGDQCVDSHQMNLARQIQGTNQVEPKGIRPIQPEIIPPRERRKKLKVPLPFQPPILNRRGLGFTRENIKTLISQDEDIRKILKDLVRVTMQKVDLVQMMNDKQKAAKTIAADVSDSENDV